ncbi:hypothetical protein ACXZ1M_20385 [Duganella sp. PWIR1]
MIEKNIGDSYDAESLEEIDTFESLASAVLERDYYAEKLEMLLEKLGGVILELRDDEPRQRQLLRIFFAADEAKANAFWMRNFAAKK